MTCPDSLAVAPDAKSFYLGSSYALTAFDGNGSAKMAKFDSQRRGLGGQCEPGRPPRRRGLRRRHDPLASRGQRRRSCWRSRCCLNKGDPAESDWVLWTPEGFYEATPGAEDVLRWVVNHGPDRAPTTLPVSAIAKLHRPKALPLVLDNLETARALGIEDMSAARLDVQTQTQSETAGRRAARTDDRRRQVRRQGGRAQPRLRG